MGLGYVGNIEEMGKGVGQLGPRYSGYAWGRKNKSQAGTKIAAVPVEKIRAGRCGRMK
jgi:hypothetical protein